MKLGLPFAVSLLLVFTGCLRSTRIEKRDAPVDTGVPLTFGDPNGPVLQWELSDGSPAVSGAAIEKAFQRAGHFTVKGREGDRLAWQVEVDVIPRPVTRAVPLDAEWLVFAPTVKGDLNAVLDFFEKVLGPGNLQSLLDGQVLPALAVDALAAGGSKIVDPLEGIGLFTLPGFGGSVALLGVVDEAAALGELEQRAEGADIGLPGARGFELRDGARVLAFADRGYLYVAFPKLDDDVRSVVTRVRSGDARGFEKSPGFSAPPGAKAAGQGGRLVALGTSHDKKRMPIDALWATFTVGPLEGRLEGFLSSKDPVWQTQGGQPSDLFQKAWDGPVAALQLKVPPGLIESVLKTGSPERELSRQRLMRSGIDIDRMGRALTGDVGGIIWFDAEAFIRNLIEGTERPEPKGAALVEVQLSESAPWELALGQMLEVLLPMKPREQKRSDGTRWSTRVAGQDAVFSIENKAMRAEIGTGHQGRTLVDLGRSLSQRFDGAFGKGHASLLIDLARLREELETPRMISGLDAMRVVTVQGFASAFLEQLTPVEHVVLDLAPAPGGAKLSGRIVVREKSK